MKNDMQTYIYHHPETRENDSLSILIHGLESAKEEWLEKDRYTKGGNLTEQLRRRHRAYAACDLYGHGAWTAEEEEFDATNISDELWPAFIERSVRRIVETTDALCREHGYTEIHLYTYSAGSGVGVKAAAALQMPVSAFFLAAPTPDRKEDDTFSLHNNLQCMTASSVFLYCGKHDEYTSQEDAQWVFDRIICRQKALHWYESGHSLPVAWVEDALNDLDNVVT